MWIYISCALGFVIGIVLWWMQVGHLHQQGAFFIWGSGVLLLAYGLIRDIFLIIRKRKESTQPAKPMAVICFESTVGGIAVLAGLTLQVLGWTQIVRTPFGIVLVISVLTVAFGHYTRDWVLVLAKAKDHRNLIPTWKISPLDEQEEIT